MSPNLPNLNLPSSTTLIHHKYITSRILLTILYHDIDIYTISIFDTLPSTPIEFDPFGIFISLQQAQTKFNQIKL